jgi:mono/diheme cytochrome c family protein
MREWIARGVVLLTTLIVLGLSAWFATSQNAVNAAETPSKSRPAPAPAEVARGRKLFAEQGCATCHSVGGSGNPRSALDQVGTRWDATELRSWITGTGVAADMLPPAIVKRKQRYTSLPAADLDALVAYLTTLRGGK